MLLVVYKCYKGEGYSRKHLIGSYIVQFTITIFGLFPGRENLNFKSMDILKVNLGIFYGLRADTWTKSHKTKF